MQVSIAADEREFLEMKEVLMKNKIRSSNLVGFQMSIITKHPGVKWSIRNKSLSFGLKAPIHFQAVFPDT